MRRCPSATVRARIHWALALMLLAAAALLTAHTARRSSANVATTLAADHCIENARQRIAEASARLTGADLHALESLVRLKDASGNAPGDGPALLEHRRRALELASRFALSRPAIPAARIGGSPALMDGIEALLALGCRVLSLEAHANSPALRTLAYDCEPALLRDGLDSFTRSDSLALAEAVEARRDGDRVSIRLTLRLHDLREDAR